MLGIRAIGFPKSTFISILYPNVLLRIGKYWKIYIFNTPFFKIINPELGDRDLEAPI